MHCPNTLGPLSRRHLLTVYFPLAVLVDTDPPKFFGCNIQNLPTMDPVSAIMGIASGAASLVVMAAQTTRYLVNLCDSCQNVRLMLLDLSATCLACETAWSQVQAWATEESSRAHHVVSPATLEQVFAYIDISQAILDAVHSDIRRLLPTGLQSFRASRWRRDAQNMEARKVATVLLHEKALREHCERLHRQNSSLNVLLSTLHL